MSKNAEAGLLALEECCGGDGDVTAQGFDRLKLLAQFLRGLMDSGAANAKNAWAWVPIFFSLMKVLGPKIAEIIDIIRNAIGAGQTPDTFTHTALAA